MKVYDTRNVELCDLAKHMGVGTSRDSNIKAFGCENPNTLRAFTLQYGEIRLEYSETQLLLHHYISTASLAWKLWIEGYLRHDLGLPTEKQHAFFRKAI